ncbi:MAG TPA: glycosyltransferase [Polyangiaceae bacterium]|nr:glycosyltransferase [Polyangiaceae bacterium]
MIPPVAHFIWIGRSLPWLYWLSIASAARHGGFDEVVLHHTDDLSDDRWFRELAAVPRVTTQRLVPEAALEPAGGAALVDVYRALEQPAARSNVLRVALLVASGGVYLDTDTVTLASLVDLGAGEVSAFCGSERIAFPGALRQTRRPGPWAAAYARTAVRDVLRRSRRAVRWFRRVEHLYPLGANNAVLGAEPGAPFFRELVERMIAQPPSERTRRYALGTRLLQAALATNRHRGVVVFPPEYFYPLGPEISEHWFRPNTAATLDEVLSPQTRLVHWYASVRTRRWVERVDPAWLATRGERPLIASLARRALLSPAPRGTAAAAPIPAPDRDRYSIG